MLSIPLIDEVGLLRDARFALSTDIDGSLAGNAICHLLGELGKGVEPLRQEGEDLPWHNSMGRAREHSRHTRSPEAEHGGNKRPT